MENEFVYVVYGKGKVNRLFEMMVKGDLPKEFVVHLWWYGGI
mgnify:CR=1 FL=1